MRPNYQILTKTTMKVAIMIKLNIFIETDFDDNSKSKFDEKILTNTKKMTKYVLKQEQIIQNSCLYNQEYKSLSFDIVFCDDDKIHKINKEYRNIDKPTDVITFALFADTDETRRFIFDNEINLGEIIISYDTMEYNAINEPHIIETKQSPVISEMYFLISHGILHLLGYDHQDEKSYNKMMLMQKEITQSII